MAMIGPDEAVLILDDADQLSVRELARKYARNEDSIRRLLRKYHPTTVLAGKYIRANAIKLAERIVKHATVEEAIDVLSRPNIDVLKPNQKEQGVTGFFTSVSIDSCGAVREIKGAVIHGTTLPAEEADTPHHQSVVEGERIEGGPRKLGPARRGRDSRPDSEGVEEVPGIDAGAPYGTVVDQPDIARARVKKGRAKVKAEPARQIVEAHPVRKAILKLARGHNTKGKDSSINLRYDI